MIKKSARFVSLAGHPLLLGTLVILFQTAYAYAASQSVTGSVIVIGGITLTVITWNVYKTCTGEYSGFDIPLRAQRRSFYTFLSCSFALVSALLFITRQPYPVSISVGFCLLMVVTCFVCNLKLKVSLHSATSFYLSFVLVYYNCGTGMFMLAFAVLVALPGVFYVYILIRRSLQAQRSVSSGAHSSLSRYVTFFDQESERPSNI